jgi:hypothetical protein
MNKKHYYCMLGRPAPAEIIPTLIENAEMQGWNADHVLFCGVVPVSSLDIKQQTATPIFTVIFSKWGEKDKKPALPDMKLTPGMGLPASAAEEGKK